MTNETAILIIEDTQADYRKIDNFLTTKGYSCHPTSSNFAEFLKNVQNYLGDTDGALRKTAGDYLNSFLKDLSPKLIILDIKLLPNESDLSGLTFLEFIRNRYPYVPVVILTIHTFDEISSSFTGGQKSNYFLNKILNNVSLSDELLQRRLAPVITMLMYWYEISYSKKEIFEAMKSHEEALISFFDERFGILENNVAQISNNIEELKRYADVLLRIAQYNVSKNDKKAGEIVDNFIGEFTKITDVPQISANKKKLMEALIKSKDDLRKIIKGEIEKDIAAYVKETFKEIIGVDEDESITKAILLTSCKAIGSAWKFYRTGEF